MFSRLTKDLTFYLSRAEWWYSLNEDNLKFKPRFIIARYERKMGLANFNSFKYWIFKRWILKNFAYTQDFIHYFYKYCKKLGLILNSREQEFIYNIEEVNFTLWRPLKILPIYYEMENKEKCHFKNNAVNIHTINGENKINFICRGVLLITNKRFIIDGISDNANTKQVIEFKLSDIIDVKYVEIGVHITVDKVDYLIRENNPMLIFALLYRCLGRKKVNFNLKRLPENIRF